MLRDVIANLQLGGSRVAADFAISVAATFNAHVTGLAFLYEPSVPMMVDMYGIPVSLRPGVSKTRTRLKPQWRISMC
jgi:hypothetical protein